MTVLKWGHIRQRVLFLCVWLLIARVCLFTGSERGKGRQPVAVLLLLATFTDLQSTTQQSTALQSCSHIYMKVCKQLSQFLFLRAINHCVYG